jgi:tetratricopeptide (TPR) repeat protein
MPWPWKREPARRSSIEERRINEELTFVSRRLKLCEDTLRADPDNLDALFTKGVFLAKIREYRRALQCLDRVSDLDPSYPGLWRTKATIHTRLGELDKARSCRARSVDEAA